jgi:hypothetical protein
MQQKWGICTALQALCRFPAACASARLTRKPVAAQREKEEVVRGMTAHAERLKALLAQAQRTADQAQKASLKAEQVLTELEQREQREQARQAR